MGGSQRRDIRRGEQRGIEQITGGETRALGRFDTGISRFDPYATGGREGLDAYLASLGFRGEAERNRVQGLYFNDPVNNALMDRVTRANARRFTGIGMGNSGAAQQALTNALLSGYGNWQDRLMNLGGTGLQAASGQAGIDTHAGDTIFGAGQQRAGINMNAANAMAQSRSVGINNLLGVGGVAARFFNPAPSLPK